MHTKIPVCFQLQGIGLDLEWMFNDMIHEDVERAVEDQIKNFLDACRQKASVSLLYIFYRINLISLLVH